MSRTKKRRRLDVILALLAAAAAGVGLAKVSGRHAGTADPGPAEDAAQAESSLPGDGTEPYLPGDGTEPY